MNEFNSILKKAEEEMKLLKHPYVGSEHLLLAILKSDSSIVKTLNKYNLNYDNFLKTLLELVGSCKNETPYVLHTPLFKRIVDNAMEMDISSLDNVCKNLLICLLEESDGIAMRVLLTMHINTNNLYNDLVKRSIESVDIGVEMTSDNILIGRDKEINSIISSLLKKDKCNPLLIGPAGVGKTAIVEELANRIKNHEVPDKLIGYKILSVDMGSLVAGTKYRGEFEEKLKNLIDSIIDSKVILFIDEIHTMVNAGGADGAINASDILKPYLARGEIKIIGATTTTEYNNTILNDKALNRRFDIINILETDKETTKDILNKVKGKYESFHGITISDENINDIIKYADMYIHNKYNPDKSLEVLDLVCAYVNTLDTSIKEKNESKKRKDKYVALNDFEKALKELDVVLAKQEKIITKNDILYIISNITNSDLLTSKDELCNNMINNLKTNLINQVDVINRLLVNIKYKLYNDNQLLTLQLVGQNGIGRSFTIDLISKSLNRKKIVLDMNEYMLPDSIDKLIGAPYKKKYIFQEILNNPLSIIQINNYDSASNKIKKLFESIITNGYCYDYANEKIVFSNTIIIFCINKESSLGFNSYYKSESNIEVDDIIEFNDLEEQQVIEYVNKYNVINKENIDTNYILEKADYQKYGFKDVNKFINKYRRSILTQ